MISLFKKTRVLGPVHVPYVPPKFFPSRLIEKHKTARKRSDKAARKSRRINRRKE